MKSVNDEHVYRVFHEDVTNVTMIFVLFNILEFFLKFFVMITRTLRHRLYPDINDF